MNVQTFQNKTFQDSPERIKLMNWSFESKEDGKLRLCKDTLMKSQHVHICITNVPRLSFVFGAKPHGMIFGGEIFRNWENPQFSEKSFTRLVPAIYRIVIILHSLVSSFEAATTGVRRALSLWGETHKAPCHTPLVFVQIELSIVKWGWGEGEDGKGIFMAFEMIIKFQ